MLPFGFVPTEELPGGNCSRVYADATRVLKIPFQGEEMTSGYVAALRLSGNVGPRILDGEPDSGAVLMERVRPGVPLRRCSVMEIDRLAIAVNAVRGLQGLDSGGLLPLGEYYEKPHPLLDHLLATTPKATFLHGDLHHENILRGEDGWVVIDPKGLVGDPNFEVRAWLGNPQDVPSDLDGVRAQAIAAVEYFAAHLGLDPWRMMAWLWLDVEIGHGDLPADDLWSRMRDAVAPLVGRPWTDA